jgi:protoheme IX farnesyltransferase
MDAPPVAPRSAIADFVSLAKPRIVALVLVTVAVGFAVAAPGFDVALFGYLMLGSALVAAGSNALNQVQEHELDALMARTRRRAVAAGRVSPAAGSAFAWAAGAAGVADLAIFVNSLTAIVAALTLISYVFAYTPLKRHSSLATLVGAVPGALPILGGWTAAGGALDSTAWALFAIMFLWQLPHFLALAWLYREDYGRAGLRMLSGDDPDGRVTFRQAVLYAVALVPVSLAPSLASITGPLYFGGALVLGVWLVWRSVAAARAPSAINARKLFLASVIYLPALLGLMVIAPT